MSLLLRGLAVDESFAPVENGKVVNEVHIAGLRLDLELDRLGDRLHHVECLALTLVELREMIWPRVDGVPQQRRAAEVND